MPAAHSLLRLSSLGICLPWILCLVVLTSKTHGTPRALDDLPAAPGNLSGSFPGEPGYQGLLSIPQTPIDDEAYPATQVSQPKSQRISTEEQHSRCMKMCLSSTNATPKLSRPLPSVERPLALGGSGLLLLIILALWCLCHRRKN